MLYPLYSIQFYFQFYLDCKSWLIFFPRKKEAKLNYFKVSS